MKLKLSHIIFAFVVVALLVAGNLYQYQNPNVVEVPAGQTQIDSTAWVKRSAYASRGMIIDSLEAQNKKMAEKIRASGDAIAGYTSIVGRLRTEKDSLAEQLKQKTFDLSALNFTTSGASRDTVFVRTQHFGDGLFEVQSAVKIDYPTLTNDLELQQLRDIRLDVVNTINDDRSRVLTYVTSPDFKELEYQSFTELEQKKELPWFWIGLAAGAVGTGILIK